MQWGPLLKGPRVTRLSIRKTSLPCPPLPFPSHPCVVLSFTCRACPYHRQTKLTLTIPGGPLTMRPFSFLFSTAYLLVFPGCIQSSCPIAQATQKICHSSRSLRLYIFFLHIVVSFLSAGSYMSFSISVNIQEYIQAPFTRSGPLCQPCLTNKKTQMRHL